MNVFAAVALVRPAIFAATSVIVGRGFDARSRLAPGLSGRIDSGLHFIDDAPKQKKPTNRNCEIVSSNLPENFGRPYGPAIVVVSSQSNRLFAFASLYFRKRASRGVRLDPPRLAEARAVAPHRNMLIVAIRTVKWPARRDDHTSDREMDVEDEHAARIAAGVVGHLIRHNEAIFPGRKEPWYQPIGRDQPSEVSCVLNGSGT